MADYHEAMVANLRGTPDALAPYLRDPAQAERGRVYQNNMLTALGQGIVDSFPAVARLVGDEFMRAMARAFVEARPPRTPVLAFYGETFPAFVDGFPPAQSLPYLGDVARIDWAYLQAVFAPDGKALTPSALAGRSDKEIAALTPGLHVSAQLLPSRWNAADIWAANRPGAEGANVSLHQQASTVVIWRGPRGVAHRNLTTAEFAFLNALQLGNTLGTALDAAGDPEVLNFFAEALAAGLLANNTSQRGSHER